MGYLRQAIVGGLVALLVGIDAPAFAQTGRSIVADAAALRIEEFDVEQVPQLVPGIALNFSLYGTAGADVSLQFDGAQRGLDLNEVERGVYEGSYTIDAFDRIPPDARVTATLRRGRLIARSVLEEPVQLGARVGAGGPLPAASPSAPAVDESRRVATSPRPGPPSGLAQAACADCAVVESIRTVETGGGPGYVGAITGGLVGAILANRVHGDPRSVARVIGAIGGALLGRHIERLGGRQTRYDVVLRLPDGAAQVRSYDSAPPFRVGDLVRVAPDRWARARYGPTL